MRELSYRYGIGGGWISLCDSCAKSAAECRGETPGSIGPADDGEMCEWCGRELSSPQTAADGSKEKSNA